LGDVGESLLLGNVEQAANRARLGLPLVATHPIQFLKRDDFKAHEARVCIAEGYVLGDKRRPRDFTEEQYFKSQARWRAVRRSARGARELGRDRQAAAISITLGKNYLPLFPTPRA
jgi:DNA polymerase-3 subunit alpha